MRTEYDHPAPYSPPHDYMKEKKDLDKHLADSFRKGNYPKNSIQHMHSTAALADHMEDKHYGECHKVKKELREILELLYYYAQTGHDVYKVFAEDLMMKAMEMCKNIDDKEDMEHAEHFLEMVKDYMKDQGVTSGSMMKNKAAHNKTGTVNL